MQDSIELLCCSEVMAEWLFDHDPGVGRAARLGKRLGHRAKQAGRNCQVVQRPLSLS